VRKQAVAFAGGTSTASSSQGFDFAGQITKRLVSTQQPEDWQLDQEKSAKRGKIQ
jgi:hypothetical protein